MKEFVLIASILHCFPGRCVSQLQVPLDMTWQYQYKQLISIFHLYIWKHFKKEEKERGNINATSHKEGTWSHRDLSAWGDIMLKC